MKMTKRVLPYFLAVAFVLFFITPPVLALAQTGPLVPCGNDLTKGECNFCDLLKTIQNVFRFVVGISAFVVTLMLAWGGLRLIVQGSSDEARSKAKNILKEALIGFLWIILAGEVVNLILVTLVAPGSKPAGWWWGQSLNCPVVIPSLDSSTVPIQQVGVSSGAQVGDPDPLKERIIRDDLKNMGIQVNNTNWCTGGQTAGCTNVSGFNDQTLLYLKGLALQCGNACNLVVTGGSEGGHSGEGTGTHAGGDKFDLRINQNLNNFVQNNPSVKTGAVWTMEGDHWDVTVTKK